MTSYHIFGESIWLGTTCCLSQCAFWLHLACYSL